MAFNVDHLPEPIAKRLRSYYRRKRIYSCLRMLLGTVFVVGLLALIVMHIDRFAFLSVSLRSWLVYGTWAIGGLYAIAEMVRMFVYAASPRDIAYEMEEKLPDDVEERYVSLEDVLRPTNEVFKDKTSEELVGKLQESTIAHSKDVNAGSLASDKKARRLFRACLGLAFCYALLFLPASYEFDLMVKRFLNPGTTMAKASFVKLNVSPGNVVLGKGGNLVIEAEKSGSLPAPLEWAMETFGMDPYGCYIAQEKAPDVSFQYSRAEISEMSQVHRTLFLYSATDLKDSFSYRVRSADAQTDVRTVQVVQQPRIVDLNVRIEAPEEYDTIKPRNVTDISDRIKALRNSTVTIEFGTDRPVKEKLVLIEGNDEPESVESVEGGSRFKYNFELSEKITLKLKIVDENGFANVNKPQITFIPVQDQKPIVQLNYPSGDIKKVPAEIVPTQATIRDDIGVTEVSLGYRLNPDRQATKRRTIDVALDEKSVQKVDISPVLDLGDVGAVPGDVVLVSIVAKDAGGNYGESRAVSVKIVPFTRGTNEHNRIVALQFLTDALKLMSESEKPRKGFAIGKGVYSKIEEKASRAGVELKEQPSVHSLLDMLEKEQYFTGIPHYKQDVRRIYGAIYSICARSENGAIADRREAFGQLAENVTSPLVNYRRIKNLTWRLFGMKYEATNIGDRLASLAEKEEAPGRAKKSITRRAELYLETLQEMGKEAINLSRRTKTIKKEEVANVIQGLVSDGYYIKQGALKARSGYCEKIKANIPKLIRVTRTAMPFFQRGAVRARQTLGELYRTSVQSLKQDQLVDWMGADAAMMQWNPFAAVWPQYLRFAAAKKMGKDEKAVQKLLKQITLSPKAKDDAVRWEERNLTRMGYRVRLERILAQQDLSRLEKELVLRAMRLEWVSRYGDGTGLSAENERDAILKLTEGSAQAGDKLQKLGEVFRPPEQAQVKQLQNLKKKAKRIYRLPTPDGMVENVVAMMKDVNENIKNVSADVTSGDSGDIQKRMERLVSQLGEEKRLLDSVPRGLWLRLTLFQPTPEESMKMEQLLLKIRDRTTQFTGRIGRSLASIQSYAGGEDADEIQRARLGAEIQKLRAIHEATLNQIELLKSDGPKDLSGDDRKKKGSGVTYTLMGVFERTREYVNTSRRLTQGESPGELAEKFVKEFPQAGVAYLRENMSLVRSTNEALRDAREMIATEPGNVEKFETILGQAKKRIKTFETMVKRATTEETRSQVMGPLNELRSRLSKISPKNDREIGRKAEFSLAEAERVGRSLLAQLSLVTRQVTDEAIEFKGGPEGVSQESYWRDVEWVRTRLGDWSQTSRGIIMEGVLEALRSDPQRRSYTGAWNWSRFLYRLMRSELCQGRKEREGTEDTETDNWVEFLTAELNDALRTAELKYYERTTRKYLEFAKSYLQY